MSEREEWKQKRRERRSRRGIEGLTEKKREVFFFGKNLIRLYTSCRVLSWGS